MASNRPEFERDPYVLSDHNLGAFLFWAKDQPFDTLERVMQQVGTVEHRSSIGPSEYPSFLCKEDGRRRRRLEMQKWPCFDVGCRRCADNRGGYKFDFIGPWTAEEHIVPVDIDPGWWRMHLGRS